MKLAQFLGRRLLSFNNSLIYCKVSFTLIWRQSMQTYSSSATNNRSTSCSFPQSWHLWYFLFSSKLLFLPWLFSSIVIVFPKFQNITRLLFTLNHVSVKLDFGLDNVRIRHQSKCGYGFFLAGLTDILADRWSAPPKLGQKWRDFSGCWNIAEGATWWKYLNIPRKRWCLLWGKLNWVLR